MKNLKRNLTFLFFAGLFLSCTTVEKSEPIVPPLFPLSEGWYQYDFERSFKGIEDEYNFARSTGTRMVQQLTWKYTGAVCRFEQAVLYDPVMGIELTIDNDGRISCVDDISINGFMGNDGRFFWSGLREENGRLNVNFVRGTVTPLPSSARAGREFDGVYRMIDAGTGREILARIDDGFYTWEYLDGGEEDFSPWPSFVKADGSFSCSLDLTTVMEMGSRSAVNYSTGIVMNGKVIPGRGITMEEINRASGLGLGEGASSQVYAGTMIHEYPNEKIPGDLETLIRSGRAALRAMPKPDPSQYPSWYIKPPVKPGYIYAPGEKISKDRELAFAIAEAAAAASMAEQIQIDRNDSKPDYRIVEREYNEKTSTAFVLLELALD